MPQHRTSVLVHNGATPYTPKCSCGWLGKDFTDRSQAAAAAGDHELEEARRTQPKLK